MNVNGDFAARAVVHAGQQPWVAAPAPGVHRRMLDRLGHEVARATSIVRYAAGSSFPAHVHGGGEEFLVLDGVFADESGDMSAGAYVRNPPGTAHAPRAPQGCVILVKLWQFDADDRTGVRVNSSALPLMPQPGRPGVSAAVLHLDAREVVQLEHWAAGAVINLPLPGGGEYFVTEGCFREGEEAFVVHSWLRLPAGAHLQATAGPEGCRLWSKVGHLTHPVRPPPVAS